MKFPKLEEFLIGLQKSWKEATKAMDMAKETMKRQFNKKRQNPQELKKGDDVLLKAKSIYLNRPSKKLDQKRYGPFKVLKMIGQGAFQLKLLERWMIYNMFNEDLLAQCKKSQYKSQHVELAPLSDIINKKKEYEVEEIRKH